MSIALIGGIGMVGAAPASAAPAPNCLHTSTYKSGIFPGVKVTNNCGSTKRVKAIWAFGRDGGCVTLRAGYYYTSESGAAAKFDGLVSC